MQTIKLKKLHRLAKLPKYKSIEANGADLFACIDQPIELYPGETKLIPLGFSMELPKGYAAMLLPRSGLGHKDGIVLGNLVGLVDTDYTGQVYVSLWNRSIVSVAGFGMPSFTINPGDRIAQMCIVEIPQFKFEWTEAIRETERGDGGFGSSGV